jgi:hypothetical protein
MNIPNLSQNPQPQISTPTDSQIPKNSKTIIFIIIVLAIVSGFWASRFWPLGKSNKSLTDSLSSKDIASADTIKNKEELVVGKYYGNTAKSFKDTATGTIEKGSINGEGTHILNREGGKSQRASLTSSVVDLDLFVGKNVEIKGETNSSTKTSWLLDVGVIKILE